LNKLIKYYVIFLALIVQLGLDLLKPTAQVSVELKYGICLIAVLNLYAQPGAKESDEYGRFLIPCTHSALLPGLCNTMPLFEMFYTRMLNFVYKCLTSKSLLVNCIVRHGMTYGQRDSVVGRNVLNCCLRYHTNIDNILTLEFQPYSNDRYCVASEENSIVVTLLAELLQCRDGALSLSDNNFNV
jgi:hypothetical protein